MYYIITFILSGISISSSNNEILTKDAWSHHQIEASARDDCIGLPLGHMRGCVPNQQVGMQERFPQVCAEWHPMQEVKQVHEAG